MRITGNRMIELATASTSKAQSNVASSAAEVDSGLRVTTPSDDPAAWVAAQRTKLRQTLSQGAGAAVDTSRDQLTIADNSLASIGSVLSQVRTLAVQASSDTYNPDNRAGLGLQVEGLFKTALDAANVQGTTGEYLFAGAASLTAPFDASGAYGGDGATRSVPADGTATTKVNVPGTSLTAASGVDVLPLLSKVATALKANDLPGLLATLPDLDTAVKQVSSTRTAAGGAMNVLDAAKTARGALEDNMKATISRLTESDTISSASDLAKASQALDVSRTVASKVIQILSPTA
ncbi:MAG TPA: hypothetical protein VGC42_17090 [Kofleriaceae bacterium]